MKRRSLALALALAVMSTRAWAADLPNPITLEHASYTLAVNPDTGVVAMVEPDADAVRFYPKLSAAAHSLDGATSATTPKAPCAVAYKKFGNDAYFIVACHDANKALLFDAATLKQVAELNLSSGGPVMLMASNNNNDPYVYCLGESNGNDIGRNVGHTSVIDLRVKKEVGTVQPRGGLEARGIKVQREVEVPIVYRGKTVKPGLRIDLLVEDRIIVETKAVETMHPVFKFKLRTYLKLTGLRLGFLVNFNVMMIKDGMTRVIL